MHASIRRSLPTARFLITAAVATLLAAPALEAQPLEPTRDAPASVRPLFNSVTPSFSVAPRAYLVKRGPRGARMNGSGHSLWLSANLHDLLPAPAAKAWPSPLRLSVGRTSYGGTTPSEYVIGLDLDAARLPGSHPAWMQVKRVLHAVRLPGPVLVLSGQGARSVGWGW